MRTTQCIACYERVGFERCGLLHRHVRVDGALRDIVLMEFFFESLESEGSACAS